MNAEVSTSKLVTVIAVITIFVLLSVGAAFVGLDLYSHLAGLADRWAGPIPHVTDSDRVREIATYRDLWMNGYLGLFFRFNCFGYLNWLAIPLLIHFVATIKRRQRWEMALVFVFVLSCIIIGVKGYENQRYAFTLAPFTITFVLYELWTVSRRCVVRYVLIGLCVVLVVFGFYREREQYQRHTTDAFREFHSYLPSKLIGYLNRNDMNGGRRTLTLNLPWVYYYTDRRLIDIKHPEVKRILRMRKRFQSPAELMTQLNIRYVITDQSSKVLFQRSSLGFVFDILKRNSTLIMADRSCRLYRLWLGMTEDEVVSAARSESLISNGAMESWPEGPTVVPECWQVQGGAAPPRIEREDGTSKIGRYCAKVTGDDYCLFQNLADLEKYRGKELTCFAWLKTPVPDKYRIRIHDGISQSMSIAHTGDSEWHLFQVTHEVSPEARRLEVDVVHAERTGKNDDVVYVDGVLVKEGAYVDLMVMARNAMQSGLLSVDFSEVVTEEDQAYVMSGTGEKLTIEGPARMVEGPGEGAEALAISDSTRISGPPTALNLSEGSFAVLARLTDPVKTYSDLIRVNNDNDLYLYIYRQGDNGALIALYNGVRIGSTAVAVNDDQWHHYAFTWRDGEQEMYVDGRERLSGRVAASSAKTKNLAIGWLGDHDGEQWSGEMAEFATFDRVLTPEEVMAVYRVGLTPAPIPQE